MGAGKSLHRPPPGRRASGCVSLDVDHEIEQRAGATRRPHLRTRGRGRLPRPRARSCWPNCCAGDGLVLATGGGAVLDAGNRALLRAARLRRAPAGRASSSNWQRLARDHTRPLLARGDREQVLHDLAACASRCMPRSPTCVSTTDGTPSAEAAATAGAAAGSRAGNAAGAAAGASGMSARAYGRSRRRRALRRSRSAPACSVIGAQSAAHAARARMP